MEDMWAVNRQVMIPVQIRDGAVQFLHGLPLPGLYERTVGDLVVPVGAIVDTDIAQLLLQTHWVELLPGGSTLLVGIDPSGIPQTLAGLLAVLPVDVLIQPEGSSWVELRLEESLELRVGGGRRPTLNGCSCLIPALNQKASSLNHAYTLISMAFEPGRRSHTGNVFQRVYYQENGRYWRLLENLRLNLEALWRARLRFAISLVALDIRSDAQHWASNQPSLLFDERVGLNEIASQLSPHSEHLAQAHGEFRNLLSNLKSLRESAINSDFARWAFEQAPWLVQFSNMEPTLPDVVRRVAEIIWLVDMGLWRHDLFRTPILPTLLCYCVEVLNFIWENRGT